MTAWSDSLAAAKIAPKTSASTAADGECLHRVAQRREQFQLDLLVEDPFPDVGVELAGFGELVDDVADDRRDGEYSDHRVQAVPYPRLRPRDVEQDARSSGHAPALLETALQQSQGVIRMTKPRATHSNPTKTLYPRSDR